MQCAMGGEAEQGLWQEKPLQAAPAAHTHTPHHHLPADEGLAAHSLATEAILQ